MLEEENLDPKFPGPPGLR